MSSPHLASTTPIEIVMLTHLHRSRIHRIQETRGRYLGPKRGKRPAETKTIRKQHVYVFYAFRKAGYRPDARTYNTLAEDVTHFLKHGTFLHARPSTVASECRVVITELSCLIGAQTQQLPRPCIPT